MISANSLRGIKVKDHVGEGLGKIGEIIFDLETGRISYIALPFGGFLGLGDKIISVPWSPLTLDAGEGEMTLNINQEGLREMPGFDKGKWPGTSKS
jgi:hypothetical protein